MCDSELIDWTWVKVRMKENEGPRQTMQSVDQSDCSEKSLKFWWQQVVWIFVQSQPLSVTEAKREGGILILLLLR